MTISRRPLKRSALWMRGDDKRDPPSRDSPSWPLTAAVPGRPPRCALPRREWRPCDSTRRSPCPRHRPATRPAPSWRRPPPWPRCVARRCRGRGRRSRAGGTGEPDGSRGAPGEEEQACRDHVGDVDADFEERGLGAVADEPAEKTPGEAPVAQQPGGVPERLGEREQANALETRHGAAEEPSREQHDEDGGDREEVGEAQPLAAAEDRKSVV